MPAFSFSALHATKVEQPLLPVRSLCASQDCHNRQCHSACSSGRSDHLIVSQAHGIHVAAVQAASYMWRAGAWADQVGSYKATSEPLSAACSTHRQPVRCATTCPSRNTVRTPKLRLTWPILGVPQAACSRAAIYTPLLMHSCLDIGRQACTHVHGLGSGTCSLATTGLSQRF